MYRLNLKKYALLSTFLTFFSIMMIGSEKKVKCAENTEISTEKKIFSDEEWSKAEEAGYTRQQFEQILNIPKMKALSLMAYASQFNTIEMNDQQKAIVDEAQKYLGVPYVWGGTSPAGFDCSGLVQYVYKHAQGVNINLPRTTEGQQNVGKQVSMNDLKPGDLLFWQDGSGLVYHSAIYIGNGEYIHAPKPGETVCVQKIQYWRPSFARRILSDEKSISQSYERKEDVKVVDGSLTIWGNKNLTQKRGVTANYYNQVVHSQRFYLIDGEEYYSLYGDDGECIGYVNGKAIQRIATDHEEKLRVEAKNQPIYSSCDLISIRGNTSDYYGKILYAHRYYIVNDKIYYSLFTEGGDWVGYIEDNCMGHVPAEHWENVLVKSDAKGDLFGDLSLIPKRGRAEDFAGKEVKIHRYYTVNGRCYYSVYQNDGQWIGYIESNNIEHETTPHEEDLKITENSGSIYRDTNLEVPVGKTGDYYNQIVESHRFYTINDHVYYSVYTKSGDWIGYIDEDFLSHQPISKHCMAIVSNRDGFIYKNQSLISVAGKTNDLLNRTVNVERYYIINSAKYYSVYDGDQWIGYIKDEFLTLK